MLEILETLETWARDSLVQSLFLSPVMSLILGCLLGAWTGGKREDGTTSVRETIIIIRERIIVRDHTRGSNTSSSNQDPAGLLVILVAAILFAIYGYAVYSNQLIYYSALAAFHTITFGLAALMFSAARGRVSGSGWATYVLFPFALVVFSLVLLHKAKIGILPGAKETAESAGAISFYFSVLSEDQRNWIIPQLLGLTGTIIFLFFSIVLVMHNIAALQVIYDGALRRVWRTIYVLTNAFSGRRFLIFLLILGAFSFFALNGIGYQVLSSRNA